MEATTGNDIVKLIDEYKELLDTKDRLKQETTDNNKALEEKRQALSQAMIDAEMPKVSRNGYLYSLQDKTNYSKKGDVDEEEFFDVLEENGLGSIIKRKVDPRTLNSTIRGVVEENGDELPEEFVEYLNVYQYYDVSKRKETNTTAKKAKGKKEA